MSVRHLIERTLWVSKCPICGDTKEVDKNPPRERLCKPCETWVPFVQFSSVSEEYKALQK